jgi:hypothetical protein
MARALYRECLIRSQTFENYYLVELFIALNNLPRIRSCPQHQFLTKVSHNTFVNTFKNNRSEQSRINGAKSRGPKTPAGKSRSSINAFKHGRFANNAVVLTNEDTGAFEELVAAYIRRIRPTDPVEMRLTRELASIDWRLARILALDTRLLDHEMDVQAPGLELEIGALPELTRLVLAGRTLVDKSRFPAYLAERETKLNFTREATLRTLAALRTHHPLVESSAQIQPPEPLNPEIEPRNEPESNPDQEPA